MRTVSGIPKVLLNRIGRIRDEILILERLLKRSDINGSELGDLMVENAGNLLMPQIEKTIADTDCWPAREQLQNLRDYLKALIATYAAAGRD